MQLRLRKTHYREISASLGWILVGMGLGLIIMNWGYIKAYATYSANSVQQQPTEAMQIDTTAPLAPNTLFIPDLRIEAPISYTDQISERVFQKELQHGVVHYPHTALPGQAGNVYIFGHSSDLLWTPGSYKNIFALLPKLTVGSLVTVTDDAGTPYTYKVTGSKIISPDDDTVLQGDPSRNTLTLQTSYPLGTALKRYIVSAELQ